MMRGPMAPRASSDRPAERSVTVHPHGLSLDGAGGDVLPLYAGAMHYFRHEPEHWGPALDAMVRMGLGIVDTYVPWGVHELGPSAFDFGARDPRLDVRRFLGMCHERGLKVVLRPGPHINAELTFFGLPERVVWNAACQARTPRDNPVVLPLVPLSFPVPSYASDAFHDETAIWFEAVGKELADLQWPDGPIVMLQVDNEGALYFRDGPYDQDYHPDALRLFRDFLREKYGSVGGLRDAWGARDVTFATVRPPARFDAKVADELVPHLDWMEFHEHLLASAIGRFRRALESAGLDRVPTMHNFPLGEAATPLNAGRIQEVVDVVGLDYYHGTSEASLRQIVRRTSELAVRSEGTRTPAYGAEVGAGFPPIFAPMDEKDSLMTLVSALAYGLRGFNLYMAVDRDRWIGAPIDRYGNPRRFAEDYRTLLAALRRLEAHTLTRRAPVRIVVPRALRRLARAAHAFGSATPTMFHVLGRSASEGAFEDDFGLEESPIVAAERWTLAFERALEARGVPYAYAGGEALDAGVKGASWVLAAASGGLKADLLRALDRVAEAGVPVTVGPELPARDGAFRKLAAAPARGHLVVEPLADPARADVLVAAAIERLGLPTYPVAPEGCAVTVLDDAAGLARAVFVLNPTSAPATVTTTLPVRALEEAWPREGTAVTPRDGEFVVALPARSARLFRVIA